VICERVARTGGFLLKIPAVRRVMARELIRLCAEQAQTRDGHQRQLSALSAALRDHREALSRLKAEQHNEHVLLAESATPMPPAERAKLKTALHEQQRQLVTASLVDE
jgi:hypothetical protein